MVKLYCDRCKKEIKTRYHTIDFRGHEVHPKYEVSGTAIACSAYTVRDALTELNSQTMYCTECKAEIECFCMAAKNQMKA